jgi:regulator of cell morphogenesis and NO signaling
MKKFTLEESVGEMVTVFPKATEVLNRYKIDYCCQGEDSLIVAAKKVNADPEKVLEELHAHYEIHSGNNNEELNPKNNRSVAGLSTSDLMDHILDTHHLYTKQALQEIDALLLKILQVHYKGHGEELTQVYKWFGFLRTELYSHIIREEEQVFPAIYDYENHPSAPIRSTIKGWIGELENDHNEAGNYIKKMQEAANDFVVPEDACVTYIRTYKALRELTQDIMEHIHKENRILFTRF